MSDNEMTIEEFEEMAIGMKTGYTDRNGTPIRVGDEVIYYKKCTTYVGIDEIKTYPKEWIVGTGAQGYVYTGKIIRYRSKVSFSFHWGLEILDGGRSKYLRETDIEGNLLTILVDNNGLNPKLTFKQVIGKEQ